MDAPQFFKNLNSIGPQSRIDRLICKKEYLDVSIDESDLKKMVEFVTGYTKKYKEIALSTSITEGQIFFEKKWTFFLCLGDHLFFKFRTKLDPLLSVCLIRVLNNTGNFLDGYTYNKNFLNWNAIELDGELDRNIHNMMLKIIDLIEFF